MRFPELSAEDICGVQPMSGAIGLSFMIDSSKKERDWDNANPWNIFDGKWGGWGPASWFTFPWGNRNVFEIETNVSKENLAPVIQCVRQDYWKRCWDNTAQVWRDVSEEELKQLPKLESREVPEFKFDKITLPVIQLR